MDLEDQWNVVSFGFCSLVFKISCAHLHQLFQLLGTLSFRPLTRTLPVDPTKGLCPQPIAYFHHFLSFNSQLVKFHLLSPGYKHIVMKHLGNKISSKSKSLLGPVGLELGLDLGLNACFCVFFTRTWLRYVRVFAIAIPSVVCRLSVTLVHPTQGVEAFSKISLPLCTLAILWPPCKILRR